ncbi:hypothetical protein WN48_09184 [Eufriesea mexicana]|uniref:Uncharacterized protein n=1 Tax=Eufriesea mexicana TaxID=516756 RepID=A0A310SEC6_9HYME|nr:hypothetical protein WN48_09184 [Eufriesea mexicana]
MPRLPGKGARDEETPFSFAYAIDRVACDILSPIYKLTYISLIVYEAKQSESTFCFSSISRFANSTNIT